MYLCTLVYNCIQVCSCHCYIFYLGLIYICLAVWSTICVQIALQTARGVLQSSKYWITTHVVHGCSAVLFGWMDCRQYCPPNVIGYPQSSLNKPLNVFYIRWKKTPPSDFTYGLFFMLINRIVQVVWIDLFAMQVTCFFLTFHVMYIADLLARKPQLSDARYELELGYQVLV